MSNLITILRAAHCRSVHHFFVIDALPEIGTDAGQRLASILLRHYARYLAGAKDPDTRFRDYHNHVVHVGDGYWGSAPAAAMKWYQRLQSALSHEQWDQAAYAAGVISHYFTDPLQPMHTGQAEREAVVHRPLEWSVTRSYQSLYEQWKRSDVEIRFQLSNQPGWLAEAVLHGARMAYRSYDLLLDEYDLEEGAQDPPSGLTVECRRVFSDLIGIAITGWARIIERAAEEAEAERGCPLPQQNLTIPCLLATIQIPHRWIVRRIEDKQEQTAVAAILTEFQRTGTVQENLPEECSVVRRSVVAHDRGCRKTSPNNRSATALTLISQPQDDGSPEVNREVEAEQGGAAITVEVHSGRLTNEQKSLPIRPILDFARIRLVRTDPVVDAPSIGPKTAARFQAIGIQTVGNLLDANPDIVAPRLGTRWIDATRVSDWQAQALLMCQIPGLLARDVKLLVGSGYRTAEKIVAADAEAMNQAISRFVLTSDGRSALRGSQVPSTADMQQWIRAAKCIVQSVA